MQYVCCTIDMLFIMFFFFNDTATTEIYTLSLHDALPIWDRQPRDGHGWLGDRHADRLRAGQRRRQVDDGQAGRSEEHTSELQSRQYLVCRLLLEKKKKNQIVFKSSADP